jgi:hypothetical protein
MAGLRKVRRRAAAVAMVALIVELVVCVPREFPLIPAYCVCSPVGRIGLSLAVKIVFCKAFLVLVAKKFGVVRLFDVLRYGTQYHMYTVDT